MLVYLGRHSHTHARQRDTHFLLAHSKPILQVTQVLRGLSFSFKAVGPQPFYLPNPDFVWVEECMATTTPPPFAWKTRGLTMIWTYCSSFPLSSGFYEITSYIVNRGDLQVPVSNMLTHKTRYIVKSTALNKLESLFCPFLIR